MTKLWGGRFAKKTDDLVRRFNDSLPFDIRMVNEDITGSTAWANALVEAGVLTPEEGQTIAAGLEQVRQEFADGTFAIAEGDEDVHTAVERRLTELVGAVGGKLHTGRSRNDQVATDFRLWVMGAVDQILELLAELQQAMTANAEAHLHLPMPGYTHLQHAQPITWGHWMLSHFWPLVRDVGRFTAVRQQAGTLPLGSAALAGTAFPINRQTLAQALGFHTVSPNSLDAVSDRDFAADFLYAAAMTGLHLSRLSEQLILFSSAEFGFVTIDDAYATGSSLMPQKKNPDTLELTRGKSGRLIGHLMGLLTTLKGLPSTYDKDLQEDKEPLFDAFDTLTITLPVMTGLINTLQLNPARMAAQLEASLLATDLADYLVKKGMPFRESHHVVGDVVRAAEKRDVSIADLPLAVLQGISYLFTEDVTAVFDINTSLNNRNAVGGTSEEALKTQLAAAKTAVLQAQSPAL
ncbi:MAG: argininosuccinate lyase [Candidatus Promineifilaceae bacterium]